VKKKAKRNKSGSLGRKLFISALMSIGFGCIFFYLTAMLTTLPWYRHASGVWLAILKWALAVAGLAMALPVLGMTVYGLSSTIAYLIRSRRT
jgi:hypothetical protein